MISEALCKTRHALVPEALVKQGHVGINWREVRGVDATRELCLLLMLRPLILQRPHLVPDSRTHLVRPTYLSSYLYESHAASQPRSLGLDKTFLTPLITSVVPIIQTTCLKNLQIFLYP